MNIDSLIKYHINKREMHKERYVQLVSIRRTVSNDNRLFWRRTRIHDIKQYRFHRDAILLLTRLQED